MKARALPLAAACLLAITSRTAGQDVDWERETLRGLDGLHVMVVSLNQRAQEGGLTKAALQAHLELRLRQARIPVLSEDESVASERGAILYLQVAPLRVTGGWAYTVGLGVRQHACIEGSSEEQTGLLWRNGGFCSLLGTWGVIDIFTTPGSLPNAVRGRLDAFMDQLVNDYLAVNP